MQDNQYTIRSGATVADAVALAPNLRAADRQECEKLYGVDVTTALVVSVMAARHSHVYLNDKGEVMGISGVNPSGVDGYGTVWMVTSDEMVTRYKVPFLREGRDLLDEYQCFYPVLTNVVDPANHVHVRWLKWMGFEFTRVLHLGPLALPFVSFERRL